MALLIRSKRQHFAVLVVVAVLLATVTSCSATAPSEQLNENNTAISQACQVMVSELKTTGMSLAELVPADLSSVDGATLSKAYAVGGEAVSRAATQTADVRVGDVLNTAAVSMQELSPIVESAAAGDPGALMKAAAPLGQLAGIAGQCSMVVMK